MMPLLAQVADPKTKGGAPVEVTGAEVTDAVVEGVEFWVETINIEMIKEWFKTTLWSDHVWFDISVLVGCILFGLLIGWLIQRRCEKKPIHLIELLKARVARGKKIPIYGLTIMPVLWIALFATNSQGMDCPLTRIASLILTAYIFLKIPSWLAHRSFWVKPITSLLFAIIVLLALRLLGRTVVLLDSWTFTIGSFTISVLAIIWASIVFMVLIGLSRFLSSVVEHQISRSSDMPPSVRVLTRKLSQFGFVTAAVLISLKVLGINLTAFTVFGGALGLGIGFGLQKVISNLISGIILLLDKSIKPGDVIEIGGTYGWINSLRTRYVSVITRDNKEHLIPNEDLITNPVINWSFTDRLVRIKTPVGVSYSADVRKAIELCIKAASTPDRVLSRPAPVCFLTGFGDSSVDLEVRFWIEDPDNGVTNVTSQVLLGIWDLFKENDIEIPFPQRDLHIRSGMPTSDAVDRENPDPG